MLERLAFGSNAFTDGTWSLEDAIQAIAKEGYRAVNILADAPLLWPLKLSTSRLRSILNTFAETGIVVSGINGFTAAGHYGKRDAPPGQDFGPSFSDKDPHLRALKIKYTKQVIELANQLNTRNISISSGYPPENVPKEEAWQWMKEAIAETLVHAQKYGVNLNIESEPRLLVAGSEDITRLLRELSHSNFGANLDIGHAFCRKENVVERIYGLRDKLNGADIEDIGLDERGEPVHFHLIPGEGVMPLEDIFWAFQEIGFEDRSYYTVELYSQSDRPVRAARKSMEFFRRLEEKLQKRSGR